MKIPFFLLTCALKFVWCVPPSSPTEDLEHEVTNLKTTLITLSGQLEKWNKLFISNLEPKLSSTASSLSSLNTKIDNLQDRAHVWDTFQLHVSAWNDQLSSLDRKMDIISKGQEKMITLETKINALSSMEFKLDNTMKTLDNIQESLSNVDKSLESKSIQKGNSALLNEFASRGILSSIKMVEKKLDRMLTSQQNYLIKTRANDDKPKLVVKCNTPKVLEEILNDVSSKVDVIFDKIANKENTENDYENEEYIDLQHDSSGDMAIEMKKDVESKFLKKIIKKANQPCKESNEALEELLNRTVRIENTTLIILDKEITNFQNLAQTQTTVICSKFLESNITTTLSNIDISTKNFNKILESYFSEQRAHFLGTFEKYFSRTCAEKSTISPVFKTTESSEYLFATTTTSEDILVDEIDDIPVSIRSTTDIPTTTTYSDRKYETEITTTPTTKLNVNENKKSCEDLQPDNESGVYIFQNRTGGKWDERFYNQKYCEIRNDGFWTVIQRRDNYNIQENFNVSWYYYKYGFGNIEQDFWIGNDFLHKLSSMESLILRIELEDFEGNRAWAEYDLFKVLSEENNYQLIIGGYQGNGSDSLTSHNNSYFSTFDRKNDEAPKCCPCSVSFGGGWWFNKCFESNLNGVYYRKPYSNDYFRGIIWEHWLGNYSLKKSQMMVKSKGKVFVVETTNEGVRGTDQKQEFEDP